MSTGKIGAADLVADVDTLLGAAVDENMVVNIRLVNRGTDTVKVRVAIGTGVSPTAKDYIDYDATVPPNGMLENSGLALTSGEKIWVRADKATVSARAHGLPAA